MDRVRSVCRQKATRQPTRQFNIMYGDAASKLVQDSKRTLGLTSLPVYQEESVRSIIKEIREINNELEELMSQGSFSEYSTESVAAFVLHLCMHRNKRCLLAYQQVRVQKIMEMAWNDVDAYDSQQTTNLNQNELEYLKQYNEAIVDYKGEWTDIDLTGSLEPPRDLFIDVRVLKDAGEVQTEYGVFNLTKNSQFFARQTDVQRLIQQGYLQKI